jgi:hypothetical protein
LKGSYAVHGVLACSFIWTMTVVQAQSVLGESHADARLSQDIARSMLALVKCHSVDSILRQDMPAGFNPAPLPGPAHSGPTDYERWTAVGCGKSSEFLVEIWKAPDGGSLFGVIPMRFVKSSPTN